ncbi:MAG: ABC transporter permease [Burkholderiaceae bacterium]|jgi:lipopolysaccharide transport system permease protein|nr:ABC transporter permease [Burkholderiaceae bacterium]
MPALPLAEDLHTLWRIRALLGVLTRRDLAARTAGSVGGWLWVWLPPLATVAAYFLVFDVVFAMRVGAASVATPPAARRVGTLLIVGMLPWMAFADAVQRGMGSLIEAGPMLQKNPLPPALFPARAVLASGCVFAPLIVLLIAAYAPAHHFRLGVWTVLPLLAGQLVLSFLLAFLLAILTAALRDVAQGVGLLLSLGVFLSPVLFPMTQFPARWRWVLWLNPMTAPVLGYQSALLEGAVPQVAVWLALAVWLAVLALLLNLALARSRDQLVDWL